MPRVPPKSRQRITAEMWRQVRAAFLVGGELRAIARSVGLSENTVLARAAREGWTEQRREALRLQRGAAGEALAVEQRVSEQSVAIMREGLLERHLTNMLAVAGRLSDHVYGLPAETAFLNVRAIDVADRLARRQLGLERPEAIVAVNLWEGGIEATTVACAENETVRQ